MADETTERSGGGGRVERDTQGTTEGDLAGGQGGQGGQTGGQRAVAGGDQMADAPAAEGETGRVGQSERLGQGGYGNDTGFVGGTSGAVEDPAAQRGEGGTGTGAERDAGSGI